MGRKKTAENDALRFEVKTRVNKKKYEELKNLLSKNKHKDMSSLLRDILHNRRLKIYTYDLSLDMVMEELAALRAEIRAIGVNINQITRLFNTYPEPDRKKFYAKVAFGEYLRIESKIDQLLAIITKLSKKWLSE
ncbi:MAG TPA: plasmid mobilization relaxosome protein MobC [Parasegetibacter sp.]